MRPHGAIGVALIALGTGIAANAVLGPLVLGVIESRVSGNMQHQLIGGEIVSLLFAAPVAIVAGVLWLRAHRLASVLAIGPGLYAVYTYVQFVVGPEYSRYDGNNERAFPLYLALVILGWAIAIRAWRALDDICLPAPSAGLRRSLGSLLIVLSVAIAMAWIGSIITVLEGGPPAREYRQDPTLFWLIRLMDLGFVVPAALATGVGLLRHAAWAVKMSYAMIGFQVLLVGAVASMAVAMAVRDDPSANLALLVLTVAMTLALGFVAQRLLRSVPAVQPHASGAHHPTAYPSRRGSAPPISTPLSGSR